MLAIAEIKIFEAFVALLSSRMRLLDASSNRSSYLNSRMSQSAPIRKDSLLPSGHDIAAHRPNLSLTKSSHFAGGIKLYLNAIIHQDHVQISEQAKADFENHASEAWVTSSSALLTLQWNSDTELRIFGRRIKVISHRIIEKTLSVLLQGI